MKDRCDGWCAPAIIYVILAVIGISLTFLREAVTEEEQSKKMTTIGTQIVFAILWTCLLYWLCYLCHPGWAWFILLGPFLIGLALLFLLGLIIDVGIQTGKKVEKTL